MQSKKYFARTVLCIALVTAFTACGKKEAMPMEAARAPKTEAAGTSAMPAPPPQAPAARAKADSSLQKLAEVDGRNAAADASSVNTTAQLTSSAAAPSFIDGERKFIRTAHAHFRVKDVYQSALAIEDAVAGQGGFVIKNDITSNVQRTQRRPIGDGKVMELAEFVVNGELVVRVPSNKTQDFLRSIAGQVAFLDQRNFDARDAQFDLLRQQLEYKRNQEAQEELGQLNKENGKLYQKADVINSRNEEKAARDNARIMQKQFEDQIAFSTIRFSLYQLPNVRQTEVVDIDELFHQSRPSFGSRMALALRDGWNSALDLFVELASMWPLWIFLGAGVVAIRKIKRFRQPRSSESVDKAAA
ncbi:MAG: DUF4349 domain-containing protein [Burkholderiales bacterium]|nr:DUF4349 domain-containing protein [Burkholderiales bacterium]